MSVSDEAWTAPAATTYRLPPPEPGWFDQAHQVLSDGSLARLQAQYDVLSEMRRRRQTPSDEPRPWPPFPADTRARISVFDGAEDVIAATFALEAVFPAFDRLPDGVWVVADSRCDPGEANARMLAADGSVLRRFRLGDGIEHIQADARGRIWVGYFDEGIFGAHMSETTPPLGAPGLVAFDATGAIVWAHDAHPEVSDYPIYDCEALNVLGDEIWCCADSPRDGGGRLSPVLRLSGLREEAWATSLFLVQAIAVGSGVVAAISKVVHDPRELTLLRLAAPESRVIAKWSFPELGLDEDEIVAVLGRGPRLHVVSTDAWRVLELP